MIDLAERLADLRAREELDCILPVDPSNPPTLPYWVWSDFLSPAGNPEWKWLWSVGPQFWSLRSSNGPMYWCPNPHGFKPTTRPDSSP